MNIFKQIKSILSEILDIEDREITPETYIIRELGAESVDLLELTVAIKARFKIEVNDSDLFLLGIGQYLEEPEGRGIDPGTYAREKFPFLTSTRIMEIKSDLEGGAVLKVKDLVNYVKRQYEQF